MCDESIESIDGAEQVGHGLLLDRIHQVYKQLVCLVLVFDQRVLLALGALLND